MPASDSSSPAGSCRSPSRSFSTDSLPLPAPSLFWRPFAPLDSALGPWPRPGLPPVALPSASRTPLGIARGPAPDATPPDDGMPQARRGRTADPSAPIRVPSPLSHLPSGPPGEAPPRAALLLLLLKGEWIVDLQREKFFCVFPFFFPHEPRPLLSAVVHKKMQRSFAGSGRALLALLCHAWHPLTAGFAPGVAVVTGGNRGIGLEVCRQLVRVGVT